MQIYLDEKPYYNIDFYEDSYDDTQNILIMTIIKNNINMLINMDEPYKRNKRNGIKEFDKNENKFFNINIK